MADIQQIIVNTVAEKFLTCLDNVKPSSRMTGVKFDLSFYHSELCQSNLSFRIGSQIFIWSVVACRCSEE